MTSTVVPAPWHSNTMPPGLHARGMTTNSPRMSRMVRPTSLWILVDVLDREQMPAPQVLAHAMDELLVLMVQAGPAAIGSPPRVHHRAFTTLTASVEAS